MSCVRRVTVLVLVVWGTACSGSSGPGDSFEIAPTDVVTFAPLDNVVSPADLSLEHKRSSDLDVQLADDVSLAPDEGGLADLEIVDTNGDEVDVTLPPLPDLSAEDASVDEVVVDVGFVDAGACGMCPSELPMCSNDVCVCTGTSCPNGKYCKGGVCVPCNNDAHCGPECVSCNALGQYCGDGGTGCVDCDEAHPCNLAYACIDDTCTLCDGLGLCGPNCLECTGQTPDCVADQCVCNDSSCGPAAKCENQSCVGCTESDSAHCGPDCLACSGDTPHCKGGVCTLCNTADACGDGCQPCGDGTPHCGPGGQQCVQCLDSGDCPAGQICTANACVPDCQVPGCQTDLGPKGKKCKEAYVVGRLDAAQTAHFEGDTDGDGDDDDLNYAFGKSECWDASYDNFYRIYLRAGETLAVVLEPKETEFDAMLKLYTGTECDDDDSGIFQKNDKYLIECWNDGSDEEPESFAYVAGEEGWYTVVVDGRQSGEDSDWGDYALDVTLTCAQANCCCP